MSFLVWSLSIVVVFNSFFNYFWCILDFFTIRINAPSFFYNDRFSWTPRIKMNLSSCIGSFFSLFSFPYPLIILLRPLFAFIAFLFNRINQANDKGYKQDKIYVFFHRYLII